MEKIVKKWTVNSRKNFAEKVKFNEEVTIFVKDNKEDTITFFLAKELHICKDIRKGYFHSFGRDTLPIWGIKKMEISGDIVRLIRE
jgi:hypothetical protein